MADGELGGARRERGCELLVEAVGSILDEDAARAQADLPRVEEGGTDGAVDGGVDVAVGEDDQRVLPSELERELREARGDGGGDGGARLGPSRKRERANLGVLAERARRRRRPRRARR